MSYFPFIVDIKDMQCLVAGGGNIAFHKVKILSEYGVNINVISPIICDELSLFAKNNNHIRIIEREFYDSDINGMAFVVAATDSRDVNIHISEVCKERKVPVNAVDIKEACTFIFPAIIHDDDLLVAVSTGGNSPVAAAYIKKKIKQVIPEYYKSMIKRLGKCREFVLENVAEVKSRKRVFDQLLKYGDENNGKLDERTVKNFVYMSNKKVIKIGTRGSHLALAQTELVISELKKKYPDAVFEKIVLRTTGDKTPDKPLPEFGGKGVFVAEIEDALKNGEIDIAVHSAKDLPTEMGKGLVIAGTLKREDANDVLVSTVKNMKLFDGPCKDKVLIGTGSLRRQLQIKEIFNNADCEGVRGNVPTRLKKLRDGMFDGIILASAGLKRLALDCENDLMYRYFSYDEITPAGGQGIIAIETRKDEVEEVVKSISDKKANIELTTERYALKLMEAGCHEAVGVISSADVLKNNINIIIMKECDGKICRLAESGRIEERYKIVERIVRKLRARI